MDESKKLDTVEFSWSDDNMSGTGVIAQEISSIAGEGVTLDIGAYGAGASDIITMSSGTIDLSSITISSNTNPGGAFSFAGGGYEPSHSISNVEEIHTTTGKKIDLDELVDVIETIKKRFLILAPNFELHEKYPMLKELYDEYKAMEKLLGGPDRNLDDEL